MRPWALAAILLVAPLAGCLVPGQGDLVGKPVPAFTLATSDGQQVNQSSNLGRYLILDLMATWCAPCKLEVGHLKAIQQAYGERVAILSVSVSEADRPEDLDAFERDNNASWPHAVDYGLVVAQAMKVGTIPKLVIVDPQGIVVFEGENEVLPAAISAVIEGRPAPTLPDSLLMVATASAGVGLGFLAAFNPYRKLHRDSASPRAAWLAVALFALLAALAWPFAAFLSARATLPSLALGAFCLAAVPWWWRARGKPLQEAAPSLGREAGDRLYEAAPAFALAVILALSATSVLAFFAPLAGFVLGLAAAVSTRRDVPARAWDALGLAGLGLAGAGLLAFGLRILL